MASVNRATNRLSPPAREELHLLLTSILTDLTTLRTAVTALTAKMDLDAGVSGTDYASTCDPAALSTTE
jgi:hypothetical protein